MLCRQRPSVAATSTYRCQIVALWRTSPSAAFYSTTDHPKNHAKQLFAGVDEAGRGPVIGPMVIAAVAVGEKGIQELKKLGVTDSKKLTPYKRNKLYPAIVEWSNAIATRHVPAYEIDERRKSGESLNVIEQKAMIDVLRDMQAQLIKFYPSPHTPKIKRFVIDSCDVNTERFARPFYKELPKAEIVSQHRADADFIEVGAASIIAKCERDMAIREIEEEVNAPLGSGYPSDPSTKRFLSKYYKKDGVTLKEALPKFVRSTWDTKPGVLPPEEKKKAKAAPKTRTIIAEDGSTAVIELPKPKKRSKKAEEAEGATEKPKPKKRSKKADKDAEEVNPAETKKKEKTDGDGAEVEKPKSKKRSKKAEEGGDAAQAEKPKETAAKGRKQKSKSEGDSKEQEVKVDVEKKPAKGGKKSKAKASQDDG